MRRIAVAAICGLPYLAASFLAQSAFKETAMALFVLAFAIALAGLPAAPKRAVAGIGLILAAASVFTFSLPGLAWFAISVPIWLALEALAGRSPVDWGAAREALSQHRLATAIGALVVIAVVVVAIGPATSFVEKVDDVQFSAGRLSSPVSWGEAFGIWPEGDFRIVRTEVAGAPLALALGALALGFGAFALLRGRRFALLAMLVTGAIVYLGARLVAEIHVEAKALAVIAPLALLVALHPLLAAPTSTEHRATTIARYALGTLFLAAAIISTLLALRAAPVGFDDRQAGLEVLAERIEGEPVVFLGVDRFSAHHLRDTLMRAPAGYVPEEIESRPEKRWQQGDAVDFDSLEPGKLDKFRYAITTDAAYASTPPSNFEPLVRSADYVLWERRGETPRSRVVEGEDGEIGALLDCDSAAARRGGAATVLDRRRAPLAIATGSFPSGPVDAAAGQERAFAAPGEATAELTLGMAGRYELSLQYHSQVPLERAHRRRSSTAELPPSLDGMYLDGAGRGAFWPAGEVVGDAGPAGGHRARRRAERACRRARGRAPGLARRPRRHPRARSPSEVALADACGLYVDHFTLDRRGESR